MKPIEIRVPVLLGKIVPGNPDASVQHCDSFVHLTAARSKNVHTLLPLGAGIYCHGLDMQNEHRPRV